MLYALRLEIAPLIKRAIVSRCRYSVANTVACDVVLLSLALARAIEMN